MDHLIPPGFTPDMGALITTLLVLTVVVKVWAWWTDRTKAATRQEETRALRDAIASVAAATRSAAEAASSAKDAAEHAAAGLQVAKEGRAISTETRDLVRGLEKAGIRQGLETERVLAGVDKLTGSVGELVAEIRASRRAA